MKSQEPNHAVKTALDLFENGRTRVILLIASLVLGLPASSRAQNFAIAWYTLDGGGGTSTGGVYSISGTVGQPDAGNMSGGNFILAGGFWSVAIAIQTDGAPLLTITNSGGNVIISWPSSAAGFVLQSNATLDSPNWANVPTVPSDNGTTRSIIVAPAIGNRFYRLIKDLAPPY